MIWYTCWHIFEVSANKNTFSLPPLLFPHQSVLPPDCNEIPKLSLHARLKEHWDFPNGITFHPRDESMQLVCVYLVFDSWQWIWGHYHTTRTIPRSHAHKSWASWLVFQLEVNWGNHQIDCCFPSFTWCSSGIVVGMWTTFGGCHFIAFFMSTWIS